MNPLSLVTPKAMLGLGIALALSLGGNAILFWKLAQAEPKAKLQCVEATLEQTVDAERAEDRRDATASTIAHDTAADVERATTTAQADTARAKTEIQYVYLNAPAPAGACTGEPPAGVRERLDTLIDAANAAGS